MSIVQSGRIPHSNLVRKLHPKTDSTYQEHSLSSLRSIERIKHSVRKILKIALAELVHTLTTLLNAHYNVHNRTIHIWQSSRPIIAVERHLVQIGGLRAILVYFVEVDFPFRDNTVKVVATPATSISDEREVEVADSFEVLVARDPGQFRRGFVEGGVFLVHAMSHLAKTSVGPNPESEDGTIVVDRQRLLANLTGC